MNDNKGFTMLNVLLTLMVMTSMLTLVLKNSSEPDTEYLSFINKYLEVQNLALTSYEETDLGEENITFNKLGHINRAKTIRKGNHNIIAHIGNGYLTYE